MSAPKQTLLLWLRDDLRLHDHPVLAGLNPGDQLVPVYVFDPAWLTPHPAGFARMGPARVATLCEALSDLGARYRALGSELLIRVGNPAEVIPALARQIQATAVWTQAQVTSEELAEQTAVRRTLECPLKTWWGQTLIHPEDLPLPVAELPALFTHFRKRVEADLQIRAPLPAPTRLPALPPGLDAGELLSPTRLGVRPFLADPRTACPWPVGETSGLARLHSYLWESKSLAHYHDTRNGLLGPDFSSKLSLWLAHGALSPRLIYAEIQRFEREVVANRSTYWLFFELLWRDFFRFVAAQHGTRIFLPGGLSGQRPPRHASAADVLAWREGRTGEPFVDANMRELALTGYLSNRGRQNVASYFCHDLGGDWRTGAAWFEACLRDYDVCSNWGNWMYLAGVGNDARERRRFNLRKQAAQYDPGGAYVRTWLGEAI